MLPGFFVRVRSVSHSRRDIGKYFSFAHTESLLLRQVHRRLTHSKNETQLWLTLKGPPFSASKWGHRSLRTARTVLAATASEVTKAPLTEGLQGLQRRFSRVDGAEPRAGPRATISQFRATPGEHLFLSESAHFPIRNDIKKVRHRTCRSVGLLAKRHSP